MSAPSDAALDLSGISDPDLDRLLATLGRGIVTGPLTSTRLVSMGLGHLAQPLAPLGKVEPSALAALLQAIKAERRASQEAVELVWTGPDTAGSTSRDTAVTLRELFTSASRSVLMSTYALVKARDLFAPLAERMDQDKSLSVRLFVHIGRPWKSQASEESLLERFAEVFREEHWPGARLPKVFYDPRTLREPDENGAISLHAKCVVVDERIALVSSANFTEAAHRRNIEAGVVVRSAGFARGLSGQFERLVATGMLRLVPGL